MNKRVPPLQIKDLLEYYENGCKKPDEVAIGMEVEKHGIYQENRKPVTYLGKNGFKEIQKKLVEELGWRVTKKEGPFLVNLARCGSRITLESAECISELSGRTHPSIHDLARELELHQHEQSVISKMFGVLWIGMGVQPFAHNSQIRRMNTPRYKVLYEHSEKVGGLWEDDWKKIAAVQANIDYTSNTDFRHKFNILLRLSPFLAAMYANSPLNNGELTKFVSYRLHVITHYDPPRFGIRKFFFDNDFGFREWIDFSMQVPMIAIYRDKKWILVKNRTFAQFMKNGYNGYTATLKDWEMHNGFVYSFVRLKKYIELRPCDSVPPYLIPSMQAIVKAFVYHPDGEKALKNLTKAWKFEDFETSYTKISKSGMDAEVRKLRLLDYCKEILEIASAHLKSFKKYNERKDDESIYLRPIKDFVFVKEMSPGSYVREQWEDGWKENPDRLIEWCRYD